MEFQGKGGGGKMRFRRGGRKYGDGSGKQRHRGGRRCLVAQGAPLCRALGEVSVNFIWGKSRVEGRVGSWGESWGGARRRWVRHGSNPRLIPPQLSYHDPQLTRHYSTYTSNKLLWIHSYRTRPIIQRFSKSQTVCPGIFSGVSCGDMKTIDMKKRKEQIDFVGMALKILDSYTLECKILPIKNKTLIFGTM